jgi:hypothetical protein
LAELQGADEELANATSAIRRRQPAIDSLGSVSSTVDGFVRRLENGEEVSRDTIVNTVRQGLDQLRREFGQVPEGQAREVRNQLESVLEQFGELTGAGGDGDDDDDDDRGGRTRELTDRQFRQELTQLGGRLETLGNRFQTESNEVDNRAINEAKDRLGESLEELGRISRARGTGNQIETTAVNVSRVTRRIETVTTDNPISISVLRDPVEARESISKLIENVTGAINLIESDSSLSGDLDLSRISTGLRRAFQSVVGASGGAVSTSGTSNAISLDAEALDAALEDEGTFRRIESAVRSAAFGLINVSAGSGNTLENTISSQLREQQQIGADIAGLKAEAEEKRAGMLAGLKDIASAALANAGAQASAKLSSEAKGGRQSNRLSSQIGAAQQNQSGLLQAFNGINLAANNVVSSIGFLQNLFRS